MKTLHIFKPGRQITDAGVAVNFSEADLIACANAYDPAKHEAPLVVGHPNYNAPAFGWVRSLRVGRDGLEAEPQQVDPALTEMVGTGRFKKLSASFYAPNSPNNPVPGVHYLRHIGFLGSVPPAVKGLPAINFAESEEGVIEFSEQQDETGALARFYDWLTAKFGKTAVDALTDPTNPNLSAPSSIKEKNAMPDPSAPPATEKPAATAAENERLLAEVAGLKKKLADLEAAKKADEEEELGKEAENFAEGLIKQGRLAPKHKGTIVVTLKTLAADSSLSFGEGKNKKPMVEVFQEFLGDMPHVVSFGEIATKDRASAKGGSVNPLLADAEARLQKFSK